jgi:16S rRNA (cytosine1402-N4)-methyltransferase
MSEVFSHRPVMVETVVELLAPAAARWIVDCTAGLGGHAEALLAAAPAEASLIAIDMDGANLRRVKDRLARFESRDTPACGAFNAISPRYARCSPRRGRPPWTR